MRKIKFRGLTDEHVWVYGWFSDDDLSPVIIDGMSTRHNVLSKTVGQFTGYRDRNDVEIYEDDLIAVKGEKYLVIWDRRIPGFALRPWDEDGAERLLGDVMITFFDGALVIGNIHHDGNGHFQYSDCEENETGSGGDA